jgi:hypothetical protein
VGSFEDLGFSPGHGKLLGVKSDKLTNAGLLAFCVIAVVFVGWAWWCLDLHRRNPSLNLLGTVLPSLIVAGWFGWLMARTLRSNGLLDAPTILRHLAYALANGIGFFLFFMGVCFALMLMDFSIFDPNSERVGFVITLVAYGAWLFTARQRRWNVRWWHVLIGLALLALAMYVSRPSIY